MAAMRLFLHEEIMLLSLRDRQGTIDPASHYTFAIGGAVIAELLLAERIRVDRPKKNKKIVQLVDARPLGDPLLDECLERIRTAKRRGSVQSWVSRFARVRKLKHRVAQELCRRGILRADEDKVLLLFTRKIYPEVDPAPEREVLERLRRAIFTESSRIDPRTAVLVSLAHGSGLLKVVFGKKELKSRKERIEQITHGELVGEATKAAIDAMEAAVVFVAVMPSIY
jgi:Golgi phosphoprotein 3